MFLFQSLLGEVFPSSKNGTFLNSSSHFLIQIWIVFAGRLRQSGTSFFGPAQILAVAS